ncbi:hypothetical protein KR026_012147 [Drosophila bipectinata]|nr:hypothetical protein KR026_012147 [Drosophila bipectinata]
MPTAASEKTQSIDGCTNAKLTWDQNPVLCMVCAAPFRSTRDCLAHELLKHANKPQKQLRQRLNAITKLFTSAQTQSERSELQEVLEQSATGGHLRTVLDFYASDLKKLESCFGHVRNCIEKEMQDRVKVFPFGSLVTGLSLKGSDIDLYLQPCDEQNIFHNQLYNRVSHFLRRSKCFTEVFTIRHARVPIIRCKHQLTGLSIDINMSNPNSTYNSRFVCELIARDERIRELCLFLKIWAKKLNLISHGSLTSYCLISMILVSLQVHKLLPPIKQLQSLCPPINVFGINYAFCFQLVPPIPRALNTLDLIKEFFEYFSSVEFEKYVLSPFLGRALDKETTMGTPGGFPEYEDQLESMENAVGEAPEPFQLDRCMCVQDPFELQHNVAKGVSPTNLAYFRQCLRLAAQACNNQDLLQNPAKLYDFLLFGLADKLVTDSKSVKATPAKQKKKEIVILEKPKTLESETKSELVSTLNTPPIVKSPVITHQIETKSELVSTLNTPPIVRSHVITPSTNDLKYLRSGDLDIKIHENKTIFYYWLTCYVDAIKDVLTKIYGMEIKLKESQEPCRYHWLISTNLDTWTGRSFQRSAGQSFFAHQIQQTIEFEKLRRGNAAYEVSAKGIFSLLASEDYKEIRLNIQPLPGDLLGLQRNSPLTKFFKALKNLLINYSFKEKASFWKFGQMDSKSAEPKESS